jgi:hypothetical protein
MKNCARLPVVILMATWIFARGLNGQSDKTVSLALPPKDWNMSEHALFGLIVTNNPGDYPLHGSWVGVEKTTVRTGWYAAQFEIASETNRLIRFKTLSVLPAHMFPERANYRYLWDSPGKPFPEFAYRSSLPGDAELLKMHDIMSVSNFCYNLAYEDLKFSNTITFVGNYFTLRPYDSIDTLHVEFLKYAGSPEITNVLVRRSHCACQPGR